VKSSEFEVGALVPGTRYRVVSLLGAGGMGSVYEVEHVELGKRFVLKALLASLSGRDDLSLRLRNEQRALGRLEHPNIVGVTDAGVTSHGVPFFVMERLEGETLGACLKRRKRLPIVEALEIAAYILDGLAAAHQIGVVHRDIKPQNVFLLRDSFPKILDFGVAKMKDAENVITRRGIAVGTPRYMSPEQASGDPVDGRSDIYAVGLLLFECIAGFGPFDGARDANELLLAHLGEPPPLLSSVAHGVGTELDRLVERLLAKNPAYRPPSAHAAAAELREVARALSAEGSGAIPRAALHDTSDISRETATAVRQLSFTATDAAPTLSRELSADTDVDAPSHMLTLAATDRLLVTQRIRTERLDRSAVLGPTGHEETRTRVPLTPAEGSVSVPPDGTVRTGSRVASLGIGALAVAALAALVFAAQSSERSHLEAAPATSPPRPASPAARPPVSPATAAPSPAGRTPEPALTPAPSAPPATSLGPRKNGSVEKSLNIPNGLKQ
jgi:serine/threonine protein kinase